MATLEVTIPQLQFIIDQCVVGLTFEDWFDPYSVEDTIESDTTEHLLKVISLLNECVTLKENI